MRSAVFQIIGGTLFALIVLGPTALTFVAGVAFGPLQTDDGWHGWLFGVAGGLGIWGGWTLLNFLADHAPAG